MRGGIKLRNFNEIKGIFKEESYEKIFKDIRFENIQEIRINANKPIIINYNNKEIIGEVIFRKEDIETMVRRISSFSLFAFSEEIKNGYITINGGHRIGICGECTVEDGKVIGIKNISALVIRINKEIRGCSNNIIKYLIYKDMIKNTLIISPPKCGKTTLIRDITRNISTGTFGITGKKVVVVDERSEIAACYFGIPQMDIGIRTSALDACPKSHGIMMAVRTLSPEVVVCDEIGLQSDIDALMMALSSGVSIVASIHGESITDYENRVLLSRAIENKIFEIIVVLSCKDGVGTIDEVFDYKNKKFLFRRQND